MASSEKDPLDQTHLSFQDTVWLQHFPLVAETALDYFAQSPFYDKSSNNEQCRMQGLDPRVALKGMTGLEFWLVDLPPEQNPIENMPNGMQRRHLYTIRRQLRRAMKTAEIQATYYIIDGTIYQSPSVLELLRSRLDKLALHTSQAFQHLAKLPQLNAQGTYDWPWLQLSQSREAALWQARAKMKEASTGGRVVPKLLIDEGK
ncbi:unnamed protein product [Chrysoparadoxa australica]